MKRKSIILGALLITYNNIFAQVKAAEEITYISPKADLYLKVSGNIRTDTVYSYIKEMLTSKKYHLISEGKYNELSQEYFRNSFKRIDVNTGVSKETLAVLTSGSIFMNRLEISFTIDEADSSFKKANYLSWQIFPTPANTGKYVLVKKFVEKELLAKHDIFEVARMLISFVTTESEPASEK